MQDMDNGKQQALFEFSYLAAKEGGYTKEYVKDFSKLSKEYLIPMISALVNEKLVSNENEFDEAMFVLEQHSPPIVKAQMKVKEAKSGDKVEIMKFFAAFAYEFRVRCPNVFTRLCQSMSGENQHNIAHFISFMDNATTDEDSDWWKVLFMPYSADDLSRLGAVKTASSIQTPRKTPKRNLLADKSVFDNPVDIVINSPNGKDRLIQEYERRLKSERELVQTLQTHCEETFEENTKLKVEIDSLKEKLEVSSKPLISGCGEDCRSKNELAGMKVLMTVRENKVQHLTADLNEMRKSLELANDIADKSQLESRQMKERVEFLSTEIERLRHVSNELNETRQKLSAAIKEKEDLWIKGSLNSDLTAKTQQLAHENEQLRKQNEELSDRLASMEKLVAELRSNLNIKDKTISDLSHKLDVLAKVKKESTDENERLQADEIKQLKAENARIRDNLANEKQRADEAEKHCELLEQKHKEEMKNIKLMENVPSKKPAIAFTVPFRDVKPKPEPTELSNKSFVSSCPSFSVPPKATSTPINARGVPFMPPKPRTTVDYDFKYDNKDRLKTLQERNRQAPVHLRSHYAVELESGFSPLQTMKFEPEPKK